MNKQTRSMWTQQMNPNKRRILGLEVPPINIYVLCLPNQGAEEDGYQCLPSIDTALLEPLCTQLQHHGERETRGWDRWVGLSTGGEQWRTGVGGLGRVEEVCVSLGHPKERNWRQKHRDKEETSTNKIPAYIFCFRPGNDNRLLTAIGKISYFPCSWHKRKAVLIKYLDCHSWTFFRNPGWGVQCESNGSITVWVTNQQQICRSGQWSSKYWSQRQSSK